MMYHKALPMGNTEFAERMAAANTPAKAKQLGREVRDFQHRTQDDNCDRFVEKGNYAKFEQNEKLREVLLGTGQGTLVETGTDDRLLGVGFNTDDARKRRQVGREQAWKCT